MTDSDRRALKALHRAPDWVADGVLNVLYSSHDNYPNFVQNTLRFGGLEALVSGAVGYDEAHGYQQIFEWNAVFFQHWEAFCEGSGLPATEVAMADIDFSWLSLHRSFEELVDDRGDAHYWNRALPYGSNGWKKREVAALADEFGVDAAWRDPEPGRLLAPNGKPSFVAAAGVGRKAATAYGLKGAIERARREQPGHNYRFLVDVPAADEPGFGAPPPFVAIDTLFWKVLARVGTSPRLEAALEAVAPRAALAELA